MKLFLSALLAWAFFMFSMPCFADTTQNFQGGIRDVVMAPLQISDSVKTETANAKFLPFALAGGLIKGSFYMAKQLVTGTVKVLTSPLDMLHK